MGTYPFMRRDWVYNSAQALGATSLALLNLDIQLDMRDLLNKISLVASVDKAEEISPEDYIMFQDKQKKSVEEKKD